MLPADAADDASSSVTVQSEAPSQRNDKQMSQERQSCDNAVETDEDDDEDDDIEKVISQWYKSPQASTTLLRRCGEAESGEGEPGDSDTGGDSMDDMEVVEMQTKEHEADSTAMVKPGGSDTGRDSTARMDDSMGGMEDSDKGSDSMDGMDVVEIRTKEHETESTAMVPHILSRVPQDVSKPLALTVCTEATPAEPPGTQIMCAADQTSSSESRIHDSTPQFPAPAGAPVEPLGTEIMCVTAQRSSNNSHMPDSTPQLPAPTGVALSESNDEDDEGVIDMTDAPEYHAPPTVAPESALELVMQLLRCNRADAITTLLSEIRSRRATQNAPSTEMHKAAPMVVAESATTQHISSQIVVSATHNTPCTEVHKAAPMVVAESATTQHISSQTVASATHNTPSTEVHESAPIAVSVSATTEHMPSETVVSATRLGSRGETSSAIAQNVPNEASGPMRVIGLANVAAQFLLPRRTGQRRGIETLLGEINSPPMPQRLRFMPTVLINVSNLDTFPVHDMLCCVFKPL
jgi:hypothetical protein